MKSNSQTKYYYPPKIYTPNVAAVQMKVDFVLGMPSKQCLFHGICKIEQFEYFKKQGKPLPANFVSATIYFDQAQNLVSEFHLNSMTINTQIKHFKQKHFFILEQVSLPSFVYETLGKNFEIAVGQYPIEVQQGGYKVVFPPKSSGASDTNRWLH